MLEMTIWGKAVFSYRSLLHGEAAFSLLPMEGGAPKGRRLESPRYEREYEESGLSYRHPERSERSLPFAVRDSRFPHMCRALLRFSHLSFIPLEPYPARFARHLPHAGKALSVVILFPHMRVFALRLWGKRYSRIVVFSMREGLRYGICFSFICFHACPGAFASCHPTVLFFRVQGRFLASLEMTIRGKAVFSFC